MKLFQLFCRHVPVKMLEPDGDYEILCQKCFKPMTEEQWCDYFRDKPHLLQEEPPEE